jgi:hypothetical protein
MKLSVPPAALAISALLSVLGCGQGTESDARTSSEGRGASAEDGSRETSASREPNDAIGTVDGSTQGTPNEPPGARGPATDVRSGNGEASRETGGAPVGAPIGVADIDPDIDPDMAGRASADDPSAERYDVTDAEFEAAFRAVRSLSARRGCSVPSLAVSRERIAALPRALEAN